jgi:hypothetical protein
MKRISPKGKEMILSNRENWPNFVSPVVKVHLASWDWRKEPLLGQFD